MKKTTVFLILLVFVGANLFSQKKNGTVFSEHEAINTTKELWKAAVSGDEAKYRTFFADSALIIRNDNQTPIQANAQLGKGLAKWSSTFENLKVQDQKPAYPDAIEYKEGGTWVQDWLIMTGIHKETGIVLDLPMHNLYSFNEEGKIVFMVSYFNNDVFEEIANSHTIKGNGKVYVNHPHIVTVRKLINAFAAKDMDKWASFFAPEARFTSSTMKVGETRSLEEHKVVVSNLYFKDEMKYKVEQMGYPDCVYYERSNQYVVYSWWKVVVKKEGKIIEIPYMLSHDFNDEGKIVFAHVYVSSNHLEQL